MRNLIICLFLGVCIYLSAEEAQYTEKDFAIDVFGQEQSEPINTGFFFHDGKYMEPPYVVKRRGLSVFINDVMVHVPVPYPDPFENPNIPLNLPDIPNNITKDSKPDDISDFIRKTYLYMRSKYGGKEINHEELMKNVASRISKLPCMKSANAVKDEVNIMLYNGKKYSFRWGFPDGGKRAGKPREEILREVYGNSFNQKVKSLKDSDLLIGIRAFIPAGIDNPEKIYNFVKFLNSDVSESVKNDKLKAFNFSNEDEVAPLLAKHYQYSEELTKRVDALYEEWKKAHPPEEKKKEAEKPDIMNNFYNEKNWTRNYYPTMFADAVDHNPYKWPTYENELGVDKGDAISNGLVVFDGKPVKWPYIVSRKGLSVWINGTMLVAPPLKYPVELEPLPELKEIDFERIKKNGIRGVDDKFLEEYYKGLLLRHPLEEANGKLLEMFKSMGFDKLKIIREKHPETGGEQDGLIVYDKHGNHVPDDGNTPFKPYNLFEMRKKFAKEEGGEIMTEIYSSKRLLSHYDAILKATGELLKNNCCIFLFSNEDACIAYDSSDKRGREAISSILEILKSEKSDAEQTKDFRDKSLFDAKQANLILGNEKNLLDVIITNLARSGK